MAHRLSFSESLSYDAGKTGITVPVTLRLGQAQVNCEAKVDTGAFLCVFARSYGEQLGLDVADGLRQVIGTVTGSFVAYLHEVDFTVAGLEFSAFIAFAEEETFQRNVLGRRGFLEQVTLGLVDYEGKLYLSRYPDGTNAEP
ncbi:MAG: aspartyl protease family protein [Pyrinomonadaceae bacterium]